MQEKSKGHTQDMWRGRLGAGLDETALKFISGMEEDRRLAEYDISVNQAHVLMLKKQGLIPGDAAARIVDSLERARDSHGEGMLLQKYPQFVDVHPIIEQFVIDDLGVETGGKLHIAKSRNDQVMADIRLYLRDEIAKTIEGLAGLLSVMVSVARAHRETIMPGYTHTQHAQVTSFGHYLLSHVDVLLNDVDRLRDCYARMNLCPLGACAFAGTSIPIDRRYTARLLGFDGIVENATAAVSSRDTVQETACTLAILMTNLSRIASDIILWSTFEFGMVELADELSDTSSAMPQKKNPDPLEAVRGKATESISACSDILGIARGLVTGYHKDFQEMKRPLWKEVDDAQFSVAVMTKVIRTLVVKKSRMAELVVRNNVTAMDLAESLARDSGLAFREAHYLVGSVVRWALDHRVGLMKLTPRRIAAISRDVLGKSVSISPSRLAKVLDPRHSLRSRISTGAPSPTETLRMAGDRERRLADLRKELSAWSRRIESARKILLGLVRASQTRAAALRG